MTSTIVTIPRLEQAIITSLASDLLTQKWRKIVTQNASPLAGHCASASEAFYYLSGGKEAGFIPAVCSYYADVGGTMIFGREPLSGELTRPYKGSHWWIRGPLGATAGKGKIFDLTADQFPAPFPYEFGKGCGFQNPKRQPSKRAQIVIDRVIALLGQGALECYRKENIRSFQNSCMQAVPKNPILR